MPRFDRPHREEERRDDDRRDWMRNRDDFGQADYSTDYGYDARRRAGYRAEEDLNVRDDYGQADYSNDIAYDSREGRAYRRGEDGNRDYGRRMDEGRYPGDDDRRHGPRSWAERAGGFLSGRRDEDERRDTRRRGPSDRVLWAVISERLDDERRLDLSDVDVIVENGEVTLNGTVRRKEDKRRIEDIADIEGVRHVQNNLRVRDRGGWAFI
jgi:hypothetical protein